MDCKRTIGALEVAAQRPYKGSRLVGEGSEGGACQGAVRAQERARERAGSDRPRGQQAGAAGHGRTPRPGLEKRAEVHNPAADERVCSDCGKPYVANGSDTSELIEVSVIGAHARDRAPALAPRLRRRAAGSLGAAGGVFANTAYGTSVWARVRALCVSSPLNRVADDRPRAGDLGGDAGRRRAAPRAARAALGGHSRAPERGAVFRASGRSAWIGVCEDAVTSMSTPRAAPRRRRGCSATPPRARSWCAMPTRNWPRTRRGL